MRRTIQLFIFIFFVKIFCLAGNDLPYEDYLKTQFTYNLAPVTSWSQLKVILDKDKKNMFGFLNGGGNFTYNGKSYAAAGSAGFLMQFNISTGELIWSGSLGTTECPIVGIQHVIKDNNGNFCIAANTSFTKGTAFKLGSQQFTFRNDMLPLMVFATFNPTTRLWSKVRFLYIADNQGFQAEPKIDKNGNFYICGTSNGSTLFIDNTKITEPDVIPGKKIFVYKENLQGEVVYHKQSVVLNSRNYLSTVLFEIDKDENLYITGDLSYLYGEMSIDNVKVKNDTLSNANDYSFQDIYLYKLNSKGIVQYGKTFLYSGNETPRFIKALSDGSLYLAGEYNGKMLDFPANSGGQYYNRFIANISSNGNFNWAYPIVSDIYYSDRNPFKMLNDDAENAYVLVNFVSQTLNFMGHTYTKRNTKYNTSNTLVAKINKAGSLIWGKVLGPVTTFESIIDNPLITFAEIGSKNLILQIKNLSYGSNRNFAWGSEPEPTTTMSVGYGGNIAVIDNSTGNVANGYNQKYDETLQIDSVQFIGIRNNYNSDYDFTLFSPQWVNGIFSPNKDNNELKIYPNLVEDEINILNSDPLLNNACIYSIDGKLIMKTQINKGIISVSNLHPGIYIIRLGNKNTRFIKTN